MPCCGCTRYVSFDENLTARNGVCGAGTGGGKMNLLIGTGPDVLSSSWPTVSLSAWERLSALEWKRALAARQVH